MNKKKSKPKPADLHKDLKGFDLKIDPFGQMESTLPMSEINDFLNDKVDDPKLRHLREEE
ncbi:MAG: hypothetical protein AAFQ02_04115 [Bacteroidota bacterium]